MKRKKVHIFMALAVIVGTLLMGTLIALMIRFPLVFRTALESYLNTMKDNLVLASLSFVLLVILYFSIFLGGGVMFPMVAGASFPLWMAWVVCYVGVCIGTAFHVVLVRRWCRPRAQRWLQRRKERQKEEKGEEDKEKQEPGRIQRFVTIIQQGATFAARLPERQQFLFIAALRTPFFATGMLNYAFALSDVEKKAYIKASWLGFSPGVLMYAFIGLLLGVKRCRYCLLGNAGVSLLGAAFGQKEKTPLIVFILEGIFALVAFFACVWFVKRIRGRFGEESIEMV